jgi:diguanylate cyclase (GGDEF)-like protein
LGHAVGDRTIQRLADLLESVCTDTCKAVRMGGEEFVLLDADPRAVQVTEGAERVASAQFVACIEALRQALMRQEEAPQTSLSAGLSAGTVLGFEANLRVADARLYEAKRRGRNIVVVS